MFALDVLKARHGDCMVLHCGGESQPETILIDGGPSKVYKNFLRPYLTDLARLRAQDPLNLRLLMISHIDDDHIRGILDMTKELRTLDDDGDPMPFKVETLWHNSFDDILGNQPDELMTAGMNAVTTANLSGTRQDLPLSHDGENMLASIAQGRQLRLDAEALGWEINRGGDEPLVGKKGQPYTWTAASGDCNLQVLGPSRELVRNLQKKWDQWLEKKGLGQPASDVETAAFVDRSVYNLASIVVLAQCGTARMLLTGDARGDHVIDYLAEAGLFDDHGRAHFDLLKMPHHGSDRNVAPEFFESITADRYVISGDGRHGNPEPDTFKMLLDSRKPGEHFNIYLTYALEDLINDFPVEAVKTLFTKARAEGKSFDVISLRSDQHVQRIDLSQ